MPDNDRSSLAPFAAALVVFAVALGAVAAIRFLRGDGLTEDQRVGRAAVAQNDALQREDYADFQRFTCPQQQGTEAGVLSAHRESKDQHGSRFIDDITDVAISGDSATATVTYSFEGTPEAKRSSRMTFERVDGTWRVCSDYS